MTHVIVTGGSSGIGAAIAEIYAGTGADISLLARRESLLTLAVERMRTRASVGGTVRGVCVDVADAGALTQAMSACEAALGPCDVLVTAAGIVNPGRFDRVGSDSSDAQIAVNLMGTMNAVRAVYPGMIARGAGRILMISSGAGLVGLYGYAGYCASKFAVTGFAEALRLEARPHGVSVSICFPPDTDTPQLTAERPLRPEEATAIVGKAKPMRATAVAEAAVTGVERGRFAIYPNREMQLLGRFGSLAMPSLRRLFDARIRRVRVRGDGARGG